MRWKQKRPDEFLTDAGLILAIIGLAIIAWRLACHLNPRFSP